MSIDTPENTTKKGNKILDIIRNLFQNINTRGITPREIAEVDAAESNSKESMVKSSDLYLSRDSDKNEIQISENSDATAIESKDSEKDTFTDNVQQIGRLETPLDIRDEETDLDVSNLSINEDEYLNNDQSMKNRIKTIIIVSIVVLLVICFLVLIISWISALTKNNSSSTVTSMQTTAKTSTVTTDGNVIDENTKVTNGGFNLFGGFFGTVTNQVTKSTTTSKKAYADRIAEDFSLTGFEGSLVNWNITSQRPTVKNDLIQEQFDQGWKNGYVVNVSGSFSTDYKNFNYTRGDITQYVDRYPESSMGKLLEIGYRVNDKNMTNCTVSDTKQDLKLNIAHKIYLVDCDNYYNDKYLVAQFYKKDIFETVEFKSSQLDLAFFRRVLVDIISKID